MKFRQAFALVGILVAGSAAADSIDINLHDEALRATYEMPLETTKGLRAEAGLLYAENDAGDSETMLHGGVLVSGENWSKSGTFDIALGGRVVYATPADLDLLAVAFGGRVRFSPIPRLGLGGHIYYAPDITSFMDSDEYQEVGLRIDYQVLPQAFVYLGNRTIKTKVNGTTVELDDKMHIGFKMNF